MKIKFKRRVFLQNLSCYWLPVSDLVPEAIADVLAQLMAISAQLVVCIWEDWTGKTEHGD